MTYATHEQVFNQIFGALCMSDGTLDHNQCGFILNRLHDAVRTNVYIPQAGDDLCRTAQEFNWMLYGWFQANYPTSLKREEVAIFTEWGYDVYQRRQVKRVKEGPDFRYREQAGFCRGCQFAENDHDDESPYDGTGR